MCIYAKCFLLLHQLYTGMYDDVIRGESAAFRSCMHGSINSIAVVHAYSILDLINRHSVIWSNSQPPRIVQLADDVKCECNLFAAFHDDTIR